MSERQLRLLPAARPLVERRGPEFFRRVPQVPGVYVMAGDEGRVLYVGQSRNLRRRLGSYRNVNPDRHSRRLVRLVHEVRSITWEACSSTAHARMRENELLRLHRPRYNVLNTWPENHPCVACRLESSRIQLRVIRPAEAARGETVFGAFKATGSVRRGLLSLGRWIWWIHHRRRPILALPRRLLQPEVVSCVEVALSADAASEPAIDWNDLVSGFLAGTSDRLVQLAADLAGGTAPADRFAAAFLAQELETLAEFFRHGPRRNHALLTASGAVGCELIGGPELDDLVALSEQSFRS